ncbi:MAG: gamma-glutamyltransferase [Burkholderiales bacterium]|jgi:gamma-glutamyltranspeptidase / glutathione hydrolase|nr:gamma-glutamyltransferase [Burkholderiales bacterium]MDP4909154.1 gamma-glutamyltransferase [Burkholderiaceae bacterium]
MRHDQSQRHHLHSIRSRPIAVLLASLLSIVLMLPRLSPAQAENVAITRYDNRFEIFHPIQASGGMVASDHRLASKVGADILRQGGNAIDAAVAVGFVLAVVLPYAGNLGGGGFMLVREAKTGSTHAIDFRETAPAAARKEMFLNQEGEVIRGKSTISPYAVAVPGTVAGLLSAAQQFGALPLKTLLSPAIHLAENGFTVSPVLAQLFSRQRSHLERWPSTREVFFKRKTDAPDCLLSECPSSSLVTYEAGETLFQPDLARTLRLIAEKGIDGFYSGPVAQSIVDTLAASTRPMTLEDLSRYRIVMRKPAQGTYRGYEVYSMPAPSSGGVHLIQMLNILERFPLSEFGAGSAKTIHLIAESARLAYADRAEYLGDPDFVNVPQRGLTAKSYADALVKRIDLLKATPSKQVKAGPAGDYESEQTTHFSVMDASGNVVSCTYTLNLNFGSGIVARGTGMLLNNEMDDFSAKPGAANAFGLLGGFANAIEPGKRPLSSMTPVIVLKEGQPWLATGTPGGARIITTVLQTILNTIDFKMNIAEALSMPRVHHQWMPDFLRIEKGLSPDTIRLLKEKGHVVRVMPTMGRVQTVQQQNGVLFGATDPRNPDGAAIGIERMQ